MTDDTARHVAADVLGAMTDDEFAAFVSEARAAAPPQLTRADLAGMTPDAIESARRARATAPTQ